MLLYNHKQEFIGINEEGLRLLNYPSMVDLLAVCNDVADLFANEPGYIHNFKNFGWITFLLHADSDASTAIVHANGRVFTTQLKVSPFYLSSTPQEHGYSIEMSQIKTISGEDIKSNVSSAKPHPTGISNAATPSPLLDHSAIAPVKLIEPSLTDIPELPLSSFEAFEDVLLETPPSIQTLSVSDDADDFDIPHFEPIVPTPAVAKQETAPKAVNKKSTYVSGTDYTDQELEYLSNHKVSKEYHYDPNVAANELGLPVDLIEEFIGDFILQSSDFKESLFEAALKNDFNNLHILSHKLKGVAANLRIEDALETLTTINVSTDPLEIEANLKYYYDVIRKLSGEEVSSSEETSDDVQDETPTSAITPEALEDIYSFGLKQYDDETLIVQDDFDGTEHETKESEFKKELLSLDDLDVQTTDQPPIQPNQKLHYDPATIADLLGVEQSFVDELLFDYKNDSRIMSNAISEAIRSFDTTAWNASAAKLKGISDNLRLTEISEELAILSQTHDAQEAKKASIRLNAYLDQL